LIAGETLDEFYERMKLMDFEGYIPGVPGYDGLFWFTTSCYDYYGTFEILVEMKILNTSNKEEFEEILEYRSYHKVITLTGADRGSRIDLNKYRDNNIKMLFVECKPPILNEYGKVVK